MKARTWGLITWVAASWAGGVWAQAPTPPAGQPAQVIPAPSGAPVIPVSASSGKPAAVVNGEPIPYSEVENVLRAMGPMSPTPLTEAQKREKQLEAVNMLIDDLLMQQFLRQNSPPVDPAEVEKHIAELRARLKAQNKTLEEMLKESNLTEAQLRANVQNMLRWAAYVKARVTDADVRKYYDDNREFFDKVTVRASHIVLRVPATASEAERAAARQKLQALRADILAGKVDFAAAAKAHSQCPSAANGGDIGYFTRKFMLDENFARAAFAMKVNELSDIVQTEYGLHLIRVTDRKPGEPSDFEKIKEEVRSFYIDEMQMAIMAQLRKTARIEVNLP
ncbi:MAG: peptidylprolyl isomerase [Gemmataceae bacterium]|nr:peptidylprolyl isomerase [Gemmataceae bacterium]MDW8264654.1 peptidylprolyl isomerase [Gemmataceae bacterium]